MNSELNLILLPQNPSLHRQGSPFLDVTFIGLSFKQHLHGCDIVASQRSSSYHATRAYGWV